jgi:hypothetical protein
MSFSKKAEELKPNLLAVERRSLAKVSAPVVKIEKRPLAER